jgi:CRP-like cAMP-binding protein
MTSHAWQDVLRALHRIHLLDHEAASELQALATVRRVKKGEHLLRAGDLARNALFVRHGLVREYYLDARGQEATRRFCAQGEFSGSLADPISGRPAGVSIECLEAGEIAEVEWSRVDALAELHPSLMKLLRRLAEALYLWKTQREHEMLTMPAARRYRSFVEQFPELAARLPGRMVASYLGITPVHLSRIRSAGRRRPPGASPPGRRRSVPSRAGPRSPAG